MSLFILTIPLMVLAIAAAVVPLIVVSHREHQHHIAELAAEDSKRVSSAAAAPSVNAGVETRSTPETASPLAA